MKILVTPVPLGKTSKSPSLQRLRDFASEIVFNPEARPLTESELIPLLSGCDGCIAGLDYFTADVIESAKNLKVISRFGVGYDRIDAEAARRKNIAVCNTPGANAKAVADHTFALLLSAARDVHTLDRKTKAGQWPKSSGIELTNKNLGILGLGSIGKEVAIRARGFSMNVFAYDPVIDNDFVKTNNIISTDFDTVIREADFLTLHMPLTPETKYVISSDVFKVMKKGAFLLNTARGALIDNAAAYEFLSSGHLGGFGLDVYEDEPPPRLPLFDLENVVLTPHVSANTEEAKENMARMSVQNLIEVLSGSQCRNIVN